MIEFPSGRTQMSATAAVKMLELDPGRFEFGVLVERMQRLVATVTRLFEPTKRRSHVATVVLVDPDTAGTQTTSEGVGLAQVAGPDTGRQTEDAVVGDVQGFFNGVEGDERQ